MRRYRFAPRFAFLSGFARSEAMRLLAASVVLLAAVYCVPHVRAQGPSCYAECSDLLTSERTGCTNDYNSCTSDCQNSYSSCVLDCNPNDNLCLGQCQNDLTSCKAGCTSDRNDCYDQAEQDYLCCTYACVGDFCQGPRR